MVRADAWVSARIGDRVPTRQPVTLSATSRSPTRRRYGAVGRDVSCTSCTPRPPPPRALTGHSAQKRPICVVSDLGARIRARGRSASTARGRRCASVVGDPGLRRTLGALYATAPSSGYSGPADGGMPRRGPEGRGGHSRIGTQGNIAHNTLHSNTLPLIPHTRGAAEAPAIVRSNDARRRPPARRACGGVA